MLLKDYLEQSRNSLTATINDAKLLQLVEDAAQSIAKVLEKGHALLLCGNGGSASDAQHIAGELVGRFLKERRALNVICLADNAAIITAVANDYAYDEIFSRQVQGYGHAGGILLGLSTSGNSPNVIKAFEMAKSLGMTTIGFTGETGGKLAPLCDILISVPSTFTPHIQQIHLCLYHYLCFQIENILFQSV